MLSTANIKVMKKKKRRPKSANQTGSQVYQQGVSQLVSRQVPLQFKKQFSVSRHFQTKQEPVVMGNMDVPVMVSSPLKQSNLSRKGGAGVSMAAPMHQEELEGFTRILIDYIYFER